MKVRGTSYTLSISGSKEALGMCALLPQANFFHFHAAFGKNPVNNMFLSSCLEYPGPAGVIYSDL